MATAMCDLKVDIQKVKVWSLGGCPDPRTERGQSKTGKRYHSVSNLLMFAQMLLIAVMSISLYNSPMHSSPFPRLTSHAFNSMVEALGARLFSMSRQVPAERTAKAHR